MKAPLIHVASLIFNEPLAIMPSKLEAILHAVGSRLVVDDSKLDELLQLHYIESRPVILQDAVVIEAQVPKQNGENGDNKPYRLTPEGIAVIPVRGSLMKRFNFLSMASGLTTYQGVGQAASQALADPQVKGIMLDVDSPGGTTHGCFELSDALYQMRGEKPIWACANDLAASAAYALASSTDRLFVTRTAGVGSVGVFALHADTSAQDEQIGVKYTYIFAGAKKIDGNPHEPLGKSARGDIQAEVDRENGIFLATVARNRGFAGATLEKIARTEAGVYFAGNAMPLLADEVGTYDEAMEALTTKVSGVSRAVTTGKFASLPEPGNNALTKPPDKVEEPKPEGATMAKGNEEMNDKCEDKAKAAPPKDDEDQDDQGDEKDAKGKKAGHPVPPHSDKAASVVEIPVAADNPSKRIADMCIIGGCPELAADYISKGYTLDEVIKKLSARRSKASAEGEVNSFVAGDTGGSTGGAARASVDSAIEQARVMSANSGGKLTQSQCMERILRGNPDIYNGYLEERGRVAAQVAYTGGGRALTEYVMNNQRRYMANLGLGTTIEDVPGRRAM